jgi:MFS family permease
MSFGRQRPPRPLLRGSRYIRFAIGVVHQGLGAGIIFGWQSLLEVLKRDRVFAGYCPDAPAVWCPEANLKFSEIFTAGSFGSLGGGLLFGIVLDRYGPRVSSMLGHAMLLLGSLLFALSTDRFQAFLPAYLLLGLSGTPIQLAVLHICNEFENASTAMSVYAGTFAASSLVFVVFEATSGTYRDLFLAYCVIVLVNMALGLLFLPPRFAVLFLSWLRPAVVVAGNRPMFRCFPLCPDVSVPGGPSSIDQKSLLAEPDGLSLKGPRDLKRLVQEDEERAHASPPPSPTSYFPSAHDSPVLVSRAHDLKHRTFYQQFFSFPCMFALYFAIVHVLRINFYVVRPGCALLLRHVDCVLGCCRRCCSSCRCCRCC